MRSRKSKKAAQKKLVYHSLYHGRERLGRYVRTKQKRFRAFDAIDRPLGYFRVRTAALKAIRKAWARLA